MAGKRSTGPTVITIALDTTPGSQGAVLTPRATIEVEGRPSEGLPPVLRLWWLNLTRWEWNNLSMPLFLERLETCKHLGELCDLQVSDPRWQHAVVFALWTFWQPDYRNYEDYRRISQQSDVLPWPLRFPPQRPLAFPQSHHLMAFASLVRRALTSGDQQRVHTWAYTREILQHFFPDTTSATTRPHLRTRALHARRKAPGEIECIATEFVRDAMDVVESCARWGMEP